MLGTVQPKLGTLETNQGAHTEVGEETFQELMSTHYPSHTQAKVTQYREENTITLVELIHKYNDWINTHRVTKALGGFQAEKSPGPDGIKPIIFSHFPTNFIDQLVLVYKACIALEYTPTPWKVSKVIFIPKPGKDSYDKAKSFRPISLSNYLLKGLEKLCVWKMEEGMTPIHKSQHGFQRGKSTESALSKTVNVIEKYMSQGKHCIGVFLDIQGAFDTIQPNYIRTKLLEHGGNENMVNWYYNYLTHRNLKTTVGGYSGEVTINIGFPQGGVCSAKFWIIAFNNAEEIINQWGVVGQGFADDLSMIHGGKDLNHITNKLQILLNQLQKWGSTCGLKFSPEKTVAVLFNGAGRHITRPMKIDNSKINYVKEVKYLGLTLDNKLSWKPHITKTLEKCSTL